MIFNGEIIEGKFQKRLNRFEAIVNISDCDCLAHVPNTGRLKELLVYGAKIYLRKSENQLRKTQYSIILVENGDVLVSIDSANVPNKLVYEALKNGCFEMFNDFTEIKKEAKYGNSRLDFKLSNNITDFYIEVKGVTLVENGVARFPDAPTTRGVKHLEELIQLKKSGTGAGVIFIIQREDACIFEPNDKTHKAFGDTLRKAYKCGVGMWAYKCNVSRTGINICSEVPVKINHRNN